MDHSTESKELSPDVTEAAQDEHTAETQFLGGVKLYSVIIGLLIGTLLIALDMSIVATAIPSISSRFHATPDIGWYGAAYPLALCSLQPLAGKMAQIFPLRWTYMDFFIVFMFGSLLCGVATSSKMFIVGRAVAGVGGAGVTSTGLSVVAIVTTPKRRPLFTGLFVAVFMIATIIAPLIGGALTENTTWRWCFFINLPAGAVTIGTLLLFFKPPRHNPDQKLSLHDKLRRLDLIGCGLFIPAIIMVLLALEWGGSRYPWNSATIIGLFVGFGCDMLAFAGWEAYKGGQAMIPFSVLRRRSVFLSVLFGFLLMGSTTVPIYYLPEWFQVVKGVNPMQSGIRMLPSVISQTLGAILTGVVANRLGYYNPWLFLGSGLFCVAAGLYTTFTAFSTSHSKWISFQVLQGLGCGVAAQMPLLTVQAVLKRKPDQIPIGISLVLFAQYFASSIFQCIAAAIFQNKLRKQLTHSVGLDSAQVGKLLYAGNAKVRETVAENFPQSLHAILVAYNDAITTVFWLSVAGLALAFFLAIGIEWINIRETPERKESNTTSTEEA